MQLNKTCFKIDRPNAKAMIHGFRKDCKFYQQSIWLAVKDWLTAKDRVSPPLLTLQKTTNPRFILSPIGKAIDMKNFMIPLKYIAILDCEYFIKNKMALWETVCSNGLFDIWNPIAPYRRFADAKSSPAKFRIQLLRIYEIDYEFNKDDIVDVSDRIHWLSPSTQEVQKRSPVIPDKEFRCLKELLERSIAPYRT